MKRRCPRARLAALEGTRVPDDQHARECAECAEAHASVAMIAELAAELPAVEPSAERVQEIRNRLHAARRVEARGSSRRRAAIIAAGIAAAVAIGAGSAWMRRSPRARIEAAIDAQFVHRRSGAIEQVSLREGTIRLTVDKLAAGERMVVATVDAEVEVRGTIFEVDARDGVLEQVRVIEGAVEVRRRNEVARSVREGETWSRSAPPAASNTRREDAQSSDAPPSDAPVAPTIAEITAAEPSSVAPSDDRAAPTVAGAQVPSPSERTARALPAPSAKPQQRADDSGEAQEAAFREAQAAFGDRELDRAAELFARAESLAPSSPLAEDALYARAVALERAGHKPRAIAEMKRFLQRYPTSPRAEELAAALGWLLLEAGDRDAAIESFKRARTSAVPRIRSSAERGLESLR